MLNLLIPEFWITYIQAIKALFTDGSSGWKMHIDLIFPKISSCTLISYNSYNSNGGQYSKLLYCVLHLNQLNEKIFLLIWLMYHFQLAASVIHIIHWTRIIAHKNFRLEVLRSFTKMSVSHMEIQNATSRLHLGHFFVLHQIARNKSAFTFSRLISELSATSDQCIRNEGIDSQSVKENLVSIP